MDLNNAVARRSLRSSSKQRTERFMDELVYQSERPVQTLESVEDAGPEKVR